MLEISVVIPTFRRPALLRHCLDSLAKQTLPTSRYEVIVCNDAAEVESDAELRKTVDHFHGQGLNVRVLPVRGKHGPAAARNRGWESAKAPLIAFTDDDTQPSPEWLSQALDFFLTPRNSRIVAAWGKLTVPLPPSPTDYERDTAKLSTAIYVTANCFCRREALEEIEGFDEAFTLAWREDSDLHFRLLRTFGEHRLQVLTNAEVVHPIRPARWGVSLEQAKKSRFNALLFKKHRSLYRQRIQPRPPLRFYAMVFAFLAAVPAALTGHATGALVLLGIWVFLVLEFSIRRLIGTRKDVSHVAEMLWTSMLLGPTVVFWRCYGAVKFRVWFF